MSKGARLGDFSNRGRLIEDLIEDNHFCCINNGQPTYTHYDGMQSHLDVSLLKFVVAWLDGQIGLFMIILCSDHSPTVTWLFDQPLPAAFVGPPRFQLNSKQG